MIEIYTKPGCTFCTKAKQLLDIKKLEYKEITVDGIEVTKADIQVIAESLKSPHGNITTVPQIFMDGQHIGGFTDLKEYFRKEKER